ncbi:hypothetical protein JZU69_01510, partial [bacterium]|nr:hypothetical protein [bacterium]
MLALLPWHLREHAKNTQKGQDDPEEALGQKTQAWIMLGKVVHFQITSLFLFDTHQHRADDGT